MRTIRLKLLVLMSVIGMILPITSQAYDFSFDGICYNILSEENRTVKVTYMTDKMQDEDNKNYVKGHVSIPQKVIYNSKSYSVVRIGFWAFSYCTGLTGVDIPSSVTRIGSDAFSYCTGLTSVDIPSSVTTIGMQAFYGCSGLTSVDIPSSVTTIGPQAFWYCTGLTSVDIPSSVTTIGFGAFRDTELETIYCHWEKPIKFDSNIFEDKNLMNTILYVPIGTKTEYEKVDPWRNFWNIEEIDYESISGIKDVVGSYESTLEETDRFDISGKHVSKDYKGLVIIRYSDGSIKKQIVK